MKVNYLIIVSIVMLGVFQAQMYPLITSRIEGEVRDKETGAPIKNVEVSLYAYRVMVDRKSHMRVRTDQDGKFFFEDLKSDNYVVKCEHEDYLIFPPEFYVSNIKNLSSLVDIIDLREGEIRHLIFGLTRGGKIRVTVYLKNEDGIKGMEGVTVILHSKVDNKRDYLDGLTDENGNFSIGSLIPDDNYKIDIDAWGSPVFETILSVKKGQETFITHTFDKTTNATISGTITHYGEPNDNCTIYLYDLINKKTIVSIETDMQGKYVIWSIPPGKYILNAAYFNDNKEYILKKMEIEILKSEMKRIDIDF